MHQEVLKPKEISGATHYFLIAAFVLLALFVAPFAHSNVLPNSNWAIYGAMAIAAAVVAKRQFTEYRYAIIDNELIFERLVFKRARKLASVSIRQVKRFGPYRDTRSIRAKTRIYTMKPLRSAYAMVVEIGGRDEKIVFHPSEKMVRCIERRISIREEQPEA